MMWVAGSRSTVGVPTALGNAVHVSSDISLCATVSVQLEVGQVWVADLAVARIPAFEHQARGVLGQRQHARP